MEMSSSSYGHVGKGAVYHYVFYWHSGWGLQRTSALLRPFELAVLRRIPLVGLVFAPPI